MRGGVREGGWWIVNIAILVAHEAILSIIYFFGPDLIFCRTQNNKFKRRKTLKTTKVEWGGCFPLFGSTFPRADDEIDRLRINKKILSSSRCSVVLIW